MSNINHTLFKLMMHHSCPFVEFNQTGAYAGRNYASSVYYRCPDYSDPRNAMLLIQKYNLSIHRHGDLIEVGYYDKKHGVIKYEAKTIDLESSILLCAIELWKQIVKVKNKLTAQQTKVINHIIDGEHYYYNKNTGSFGISKDSCGRLYTTKTIRSLIEKNILFLDKDFNLRFTDFGKFVMERHPINNFY